MFKRCLFLLTLAIGLCPGSRAQSDPPATLEIETANLIIYRHDMPDPTRVASEAGPTTALPLRTFMAVTWIGDVVAVNGAPAKGTLTVRGSFISLNRNPAVGTGIADTTASLASDWIFDIQRPDGSPVGSIMASGWAFGDRAAGMLAPGQGNLAVLGGTGAFLGVRGQGKESSVAAGARSFASTAEDPANRRTLGGSIRRHTLQLLSMDRPVVLESASGPLIFHPDFSPVTAANPARRGETLIAAVTNLGPTLPGKDPGAAFASEPLQLVASPVQVRVNGTAVSAVNQVGWPGTTGTYRVDFRVPEDAAPGMANVQVVAAWIPGRTARIPVQ